MSNEKIGRRAIVHGENGNYSVFVEDLATRKEIADLERSLFHGGEFDDSDKAWEYARTVAQNVHWDN